jgi:lipid-A-disaccharide synthase
MGDEIMIVAGEASGDLHGSRLVAELRTMVPSIHFSGMGGDELNRAGVELLCDAAKISVVGVFEVISHLGDILAAQRVLRRRLSRGNIKLLILVDLPDFNLLLARRAKKLGIPIFYYISPQIWAWRKGRVRTMADRIDRIGVILPFEESFYRSHGVDAHYVGHPLLDSVVTQFSTEEFKSRYAIAPGVRVVGLLPGSRVKEVKRLLPLFLDAAREISEKSSERFSFVIPRASTISEDELDRCGLAGYRDLLDIRVVSDHRYELMASCEAVITASGTVTLELLLLNTPMIVTYKLSPLTYWLGRMLVRIDYFSLVNLIAGKRIVPELLQDEVTAPALAKWLDKLLYDERTAYSMRRDFKTVRKLLGEPGASRRAAQVALELLPENG